MAISPHRIVYLDNLRNVLVYNVVVLHVVQMFGYPLFFWWAVTDQEGSSRFYETGLIGMDIYLMPCLLFIAALFILPSLNKRTPLEYIKKRFFRLCVPAVVFLFCAGDIYFQLLLTRLNRVAPSYLETFLNFWRFYFNMPGISVSGSEKTLNAVTFNLQHVWFLTLLFFITLMVVLWSLLLKKNNSEPTKVDGSNKVISKTIIFAAALGLAYAAVHIYYVGRQINFSAWLLVGKVVQFQLNKIWVLLPLFLFGLYVYKKNWLTRSDIGSWKMWGGAAFLLLAIYLLIYHFGILPALEEIFKVVDRNMQSDDKMEMPVVADSIRRAFLLTWILLPPVCVFLLMFFLSFAKRFFNQPNAATTFCSKHSINVYVLHYAPVLILQYTFLNVAVPSMVKILLMAIIIIPACLWLSHRLVYPYPKAAIAFFVALKLMALAAGFTFYCFALLALIFISFAGAVYGSVKYLNARTTGLKSA